jgi:hypothetical protein
MIFKHFTKKKFIGFKTPILNHTKDVRTLLKPQKALWLSCGDDWINLLKKGTSTKPMPTYEYTMNVDVSNVIILNTYKDIKNFTEKYMSATKYVILEDAFHDAIDWNKVKKDYSGIYIKNPNIKKAKDEYLWYKSFEICSAAIWDKKAILEYSDPIKIKH